MRTVLRSHFKLLVIVSGLLLAVAGVALADVIVPDGDVVAAGNQAGTNASPLDLGSVKGGVQVKPQVSFELQCQTGSNHIDDTQGVDIAYSSADSTIPSGATVSATSAHIGSTQTTGQNADFGVPSSWPDDGTQCPNPDPNPIVDNGNSTVTITAPSAAGTYNFVVTYTTTPTPAGNNDGQALQGNGKVSVFYKLTVDNTAPAAPAITSPSNNSIDADGAFTVSGTAEAGSTVELFDNGTSKGTTQADASGNWSKQLTGLANGPHSFTATAKDAAGNTSGPSTPVLVTVQAQQAANLSVAAASGTYGGTADLTGKLTSGGTGVAGKTISFKLNGNNVVGTATTQPDDPNTGAVNEAGNFKLTGASLSGINAGTYLGSATTPGVSASFGGDSGFSASSGTANLTVDKAPSDVQVSCPTTAVTYTGNPLEPCTAKVTGTGVHH